MSMRWWHAKRRGLSGLGLFALALQLVLSFGHVHARDLRPSEAAQAALKQSSSVPERNPSGLPDDECPICATMHIVASGLLPVPPTTLAPTDFAQCLQLVLIEAVSPGVTRHILFQTRAPPAV
jgi:hypothetical protein